MKPGRTLVAAAATATLTMPLAIASAPATAATSSSALVQLDTAGAASATPRGISNVGTAVGRLEFGLQGIDDGVVVGYADTNRTRAFRWRADTGLSYLPGLADPGGELALAVGRDGLIVGEARALRGP